MVISCLRFSLCYFNLCTCKCTKIYYLFTVLASGTASMGGEESCLYDMALCLNISLRFLKTKELSVSLVTECGGVSTRLILPVYAFW